MRPYFTHHTGKHDENQTYGMLCNMEGNGNIVVASWEKIGGISLGEISKTYKNFKILFSPNRAILLLCSYSLRNTYMQKESPTRVFNIYNSEN